MGVMIAIDDFGTGYSSLSQLQQLPVDEIKIDRSFVTRMETDRQDAVLVHSIIDLGRNLGLRVTAEGVETENVKQVLAELGCDYAQGFHVGRPAVADECTRYLGGREPAPVIALAAERAGCRRRAASRRLAGTARAGSGSRSRPSRSSAARRSGPQAGWPAVLRMRLDARAGGAVAGDRVLALEPAGGGVGGGDRVAPDRVARAVGAAVGVADVEPVVVVLGLARLGGATGLLGQQPGRDDRGIETGVARPGARRTAAGSRSAWLWALAGRAAPPVLETSAAAPVSGPGPARRRSCSSRPRCRRSRSRCSGWRTVAPRPRGRTRSEERRSAPGSARPGLRHR